MKSVEESHWFHQWGDWAQELWPLKAKKTSDKDFKHICLQEQDELNGNRHSSAQKGNLSHWIICFMQSTHVIGACFS